jgi:hypothetical protein
MILHSCGLKSYPFQKYHYYRARDNLFQLLPGHALLIKIFYNMPIIGEKTCFRLKISLIIVLIFADLLNFADSANRKFAEIRKKMKALLVCRGS